MYINKYACAFMHTHMNIKTNVCAYIHKHRDHKHMYINIHTHTHLNHPLGFNLHCLSKNLLPTPSILCLRAPDIFQFSLIFLLTWNHFLKGKIALVYHLLEYSTDQHLNLSLYLLIIVHGGRGSAFLNLLD